jgi:outer membrane biosynthesis protein TonB
VIRFLIEAAFIVLIAAAAAIAHLGKLWIALAVGAAWVLVALVERSVQADNSRLRQGRLSFLFGRSEAETPDVEPVERELPPPPSHVTVLESEPEEREPEPEPEPVQLQSVPDPPPEPEPEREPEAEVETQPQVAYLPRVDGSPREWNVWELERLAREREGQDPTRDEELAFLLVELRQFANADGDLPVSFDPIVRDAFGDDLYTAV